MLLYQSLLTEEVNKMLVQTLALTKLDYCSSVWGGLHKSLVNKLQTAMNFANGIIFCARKNDPVTPLLQQVNWLINQNTFP